MMSYSEYMADRYEEQEMARAEMAYEEECDAGFEGTFEEFLAEVAASRKQPEPVVVDESCCCDDIPF